MNSIPVNALKKYLSLCIILLLSTQLLFAQNCSQKLEQADVLYQKGQFSDVIKLILDCASSENETEQWQANRWLALCYLANNEQDLARDAARLMMKLNPTYKPSSLKDPSELAKLLESIPVIPQLSLGMAFSLGTNSTLPNITDVYMVAEQTKKYQGLNSFQLALSSNYQINKILAVDFSAMVSSKKYKLDYSFGNWDLNMDENLTYINLPIALRYMPELNFAVKPYIQLGGYAGYMVFANNNFYANYKPSNESYSAINLNSTDRRNRLDLGVVGAIGFNYKVGAGQAFLQASYFNSLRNAVDENTRYSNKQLVYSYYYVDDNFKLNNLAIGIGYSFFINYKVLND